jgi:hypothetical protein
VAELPPTRGAAYEVPEELEELPEDAIILLRSSPHHSAPDQSVPERSPIELLSPAVEDDDEIIELGEDAIVGEGRGAHRPQPRTPVVQSQASIVINARNAGDSPYPRGEKTVVIRDRRMLDGSVRRTQALKPEQRGRERALYFSAGIVAALLGTGVVAWLSSEARDAAGSRQSESPTIGRESSTRQAAPSESERESRTRAEGTPRVSIDELPVADQQR